MDKESYDKAKAIQDEMTTLGYKLANLHRASSGCGYKLEFTPAGSFSSGTVSLEDTDAIRIMLQAEILSVEKKISDLDTEFKNL